MPSPDVSIRAADLLGCSERYGTWMCKTDAHLHLTLMAHRLKAVEQEAPNSTMILYLNIASKVTSSREHCTPESVFAQ